MPGCQSPVEQRFVGPAVLCAVQMELELPKPDDGAAFGPFVRHGHERRGRASRVIDSGSKRSGGTFSGRHGAVAATCLRLTADESKQGAGDSQPSRFDTKLLHILAP